MKDLYNNNTGRNGFFKVSPFLIVVLLVIFIPLSVVTSICYFQTKKNSNTPTFFSNVVVKSDAKFDQYDINVGDNVLVKMQDQELSKVGVLVAYFDATEQQPEDGSPVRLGYLQYFGKDASGETVYGFVGNEKLIISDAIIGVYETNSSALIGLIGFLSSNLALILLSIAPLGFIFVLLVLDILEQKRIKQTNKEIFVVLNPEDKKQNTDLENLSKIDEEKQIDVAKDEKPKTQKVQTKKSLEQVKLDEQAQDKKLESQNKQNNQDSKQQTQKTDSLEKENQQNKKAETQQQQSKSHLLENSSKISTVGVKEEVKQQPAKPQKPETRSQIDGVQKPAMPQKPVLNDKTNVQGNSVVEKQNVQKSEDIQSNIKETKDVVEKTANNTARPERPDRANHSAQKEKMTENKINEGQKQSTASADALPPRAPQKQVQPPQKPVQATQKSAQPPQKPASAPPPKAAQKK